MFRSLSLACLTLALAACSFANGDAQLVMPSPPKPLDPDFPIETPAAPEAPPKPVDPTLPAGCDVGFTYEGFGGTQLEVGRDDDMPGYDRDRIKPLSALRGEYARVLGKTPAVLETLANTFGTSQPRWSAEPEASAVSLFSSMRIAFAGCLELTNVAEYDAMPDATNSEEKCRAFAKRFWSRWPDGDELASCVDVMTTKVAAEPAARRKWAYGCAAVLSSAGFLTY